jgi:hypothetical protein
MFFFCSKSNQLSLKFFQTLKAIANIVKNEKEMKDKISQLDEKANKTIDYLASNYTYYNSLIKKEFNFELDQLNKNLNNKIDSLIVNYKQLLNSTKLNTKKIIEIENQIQKSEANQFRFFRIINANSSKCLTDTGKGNQINLQECKYELKNPAQAWRILPSTEGWFSIISSNNRTLDVPNGKKVAGNLVQSWNLNMGEAQRWALDPIGDFFYIRLVGSNCLRLDFNDYTSQVGVFDCKKDADEKIDRQKFYVNVYNM